MQARVRLRPCNEEEILQMMHELVLKCRSYRRFQEDQPIDQATMKELVDLGRLAASGGNMQTLKYIVSCTPEKNDLIFPNLVWAGYLSDWDGPVKGERPTAHIIMLGDTEISTSFGVDHGISAQNIVLGAAEKGIGACMIGSIKREKLRAALEIPKHFEILLAISLGYPGEEVVLEASEPNGSIKYWRDADGVHHVPKRPLDEVLIG
jgi:nitroreductase